MSTSYQNLDVRVVGLENALAFVMRSLRVREMIGSPLEAKPLVRETDMLTYYQEQLRGGLLEPAPATEQATDPQAESSAVENVNG